MPKKVKTTTRGNELPDRFETNCKIEIKNSTAQLVFVYINDRDIGSINSDKTFTNVSPAGRLKVYTRTDRDNINFLYWGPNYFFCGGRIKDGELLLEVKPAKKK